MTREFRIPASGAVALRTKRWHRSPRSTTISGMVRMLLVCGVYRGSNARTRAPKPPLPPQLFEALEPRLLLSADLNPAHEALLDAAARPWCVGSSRSSRASRSLPSRQSNAIIRSTRRSAVTPSRSPPARPRWRERRRVPRRSPSKASVGPSPGPPRLRRDGGEAQCRLRRARQFVTETPVNGEYSTIYVGGDSANSRSGAATLGLAEKSTTKRRPHDRAFVFSDNTPPTD